MSRVLDLYEKSLALPSIGIRGCLAYEVGNMDANPRDSMV